MKRRTSKLKKKKRILRLIDIIIVLCLIVLVLEIGYGVYSKFFKKEKSIYFDGINSIIEIEK